MAQTPMPYETRDRRRLLLSEPLSTEAVFGAELFLFCVFCGFFAAGFFAAGFLVPGFLAGDLAALFFSVGFFAGVLLVAIE
jgi:hypothetical protein